MSQPPKHGDVDILALIEEIHGGSAEDLRDAVVTRAVHTLEQSHRRAAEAMRQLTVSGVRTPSTQAAVGRPTTKALPAHDPEPLTATQEPAHGTVQVQSGQGADVNMVERTLTHIVRPRGNK